MKTKQIFDEELLLRVAILMSLNIRSQLWTILIFVIISVVVVVLFISIIVLQYYRTTTTTNLFTWKFRDPTIEIMGVERSGLNFLQKTSHLNKCQLSRRQNHLQFELLLILLFEVL